MYNILRKSIKVIVAGLALLFVSGCTTIDSGSLNQEVNTSTLDSIFSEERDSVVYLNTKENEVILNTLLDSLEVEGMSRDTIINSNEIFLGFSEDFTKGFDVIVRGKFSKWKADLGLFLSFDWKKTRRDGHSFWRSKDGVELFFVDDTTLIMSTVSITGLITSVENSYLSSPTSSVLFELLDVDGEKLQELSKGFLRSGVEYISISLENEDLVYYIEAEIGLESDKKATAFSRLLKLSLTLGTSFSKDDEISNIGKEFEISTSDAAVIIRNMHLTDKKIVELINSVILKDEGVE